MNSYSEGTLNRVEEINTSTGAGVGVAHGSWDAANDSRVCRFCHAVNNTDLRTSEMRGTVVTVTGTLSPPPSNPEASPVTGQTFRLKPPAHPMGRCGIRVIPGASIDTALSERLPAEVTLLT